VSSGPVISEDNSDQKNI